MATYKIIKFFPNSDGWNVGDVIDLADAKSYIEQGLVEEIKKEESDPKWAGVKSKEMGFFPSLVKRLLKRA